MQSRFVRPHYPQQLFEEEQLTTKIATCDDRQNPWLNE